MPGRSTSDASDLSFQEFTAVTKKVIREFVGFFEGGRTEEGGGR